MQIMGLFIIWANTILSSFLILGTDDTLGQNIRDGSQSVLCQWARHSECKGEHGGLTKTAWHWVALDDPE